MDRIRCRSKETHLTSFTDRDMRDDFVECATIRRTPWKCFHHLHNEALERFRVRRCEPDHLICEPAEVVELGIEWTHSRRDSLESGQYGVIHVCRRHEWVQQGEMGWHPPPPGRIELVSELVEDRVQLG